MRRLNPQTGQQFKRGDTREDGRLFKCYTGRVKRDGYEGEHWTTPEVLQSTKQYNLRNSKEWCLNNPARYKQSAVQWRKNNLEKKRVANKAWVKQNPDKDTASKRKYAEANRDKKNARSRIYAKLNPHVALASTRKRQTAKMQRTPPWLTVDDFWLIKEAYALAKLRERVLGGKWHVDHIVPLQGDNVSGLHVPWNIQVIPAKLNLQKQNRWGDAITKN
jgi:hypothetical protein